MVELLDVAKVELYYGQADIQHTSSATTLAIKSLCSLSYLTLPF